MEEIRRSPVEGTVVEIPLFTKVFLHPNGGWPWDFWLPSTVVSEYFIDVVKTNVYHIKGIVT